MRRVTPRPFNHSSIQLVDNSTLFITFPPSAEVKANDVNLTLPRAALRH